MSAGKGSKPRPTDLKKYAENYGTICWEKTKVKAIECPDCGDLVFSRARHDFRSCSCGAVSIDGGFDYLKVAGKIRIEDNKIITKQIEVSASKNDLYWDWAKGRDKFGLIKGKKKN